MGWIWGRSTEKVDFERRMAAAREVSLREDKGRQLQRCTSDVERRSLCLQWAGELRDQWYAGQRQAVIDMILSEDRRYHRMSIEARKKIGEIKWGKSLQAKELAATEQMYSRWAVQYAGGPGGK